MAGTASTEDAFSPLRTALEKAGIRYAVGGSWASTAFGEPRFTNDVDLLVEVTLSNIGAFLKLLPKTFFADLEDAEDAIRRGKAFNIFYAPSAFKFDIFPASAYPLAASELDRVVLIPNSGLSPEPIPFASPEDILLAKLNWFRLGGQISEVQWRDILGLIRTRKDTLDRGYLEEGAGVIGVRALLDRAFQQV
jgi:hypothetical protein